MNDRTAGATGSFVATFKTFVNCSYPPPRKNIVLPEPVVLMHKLDPPADLLPEALRVLSVIELPLLEKVHTLVIGFCLQRIAGGLGR